MPVHAEGVGHILDDSRELSRMVPVENEYDMVEAFQSDGFHLEDADT